MRATELRLQGRLFQGKDIAVPEKLVKTRVRASSLRICFGRGVIVRTGYHIPPVLTGLRGSAGDHGPQAARSCQRATGV